tara:strand:+ start:653 stop:823 length:171 start_codon:yes stop_codon:yes gene_type:complete
MENQIIDWMSNNWEWVLLAFMVAEKAVKMSPSDKDDIIVDVIWKGISQMVGKGKEA